MSAFSDRSHAALVGAATLGRTVLAAIDQWAEIDHGQLLREAVLPVWLTIGAVGFLYPFTLYMSYEQLLKRMRWRANGRPVWRQQLAVLVSAGPRLSVVRELQDAASHDVVDAEEFRAALRAIRHVRRERRAEHEAERAAAQRLIDTRGWTGGTTTASASTNARSRRREGAAMGRDVPHGVTTGRTTGTGETSCRSLNLTSFATDCPRSTRS